MENLWSPSQATRITWEVFIYLAWLKHGGFLFSSAMSGAMFRNPQTRWPFRALASWRVWESQLLNLSGPCPKNQLLTPTLNARILPAPAPPWASSAFRVYLGLWSLPSGPSSLYSPGNIYCLLILPSLCVPAPHSWAYSWLPFAHLILTQSHLAILLGQEWELQA